MNLLSCNQEPPPPPRVSVVVPVYNVLPYLDRCLESLQAQTFRNFETILVDDGSTDGCGGRCDEWAGRLPGGQVVHQFNGGLANARNTGVAAAAGEWVVFVDSDDFVAPDYLAYLLGLVESNHVNMASCRFVRTTGSSIDGREGDGGCEVGRNRVESCTLLQQGMLTDTMWGKIFRRAILLSVPQPDGRFHEDTAVIAKIVWLSESIAIGSKALYGYFVNGNSIIHDPSPKRLNDLLWAGHERVLFYRSVTEPVLERLAWDKLAKTILAMIKSNAMPVADLRLFWRQSGMKVLSVVTLKCRLALDFPQLYRIESQIKGMFKNLSGP